MEHLKRYALPLAALVLFAAWWLVVRPLMLADAPAPAEQDAAAPR
jgi:hypothetical protein